MKEILTPSVARRAGFSLGLLAICELSRHIPLPLPVLTVAQGESFVPTPFILGIWPFLYGFLAVELFSLIVPAGRRLRREGVLGRSKLNRAAVAVSLLIILFQVTTRATKAISSGSLETSTPTLTRLYLVLVWTAGAGVLYWLASKASDLGLVNGFCLLVGYDLIMRLWSLQGSELDLDPETLLGSLVLIVLTVFGLWRFLGSPARVDVIDSKRRSLRVEVPAFSASILPALAVGWFLQRSLLDFFETLRLWRLQQELQLVQQQLDDLLRGNYEDVESLGSWSLLDPSSTSDTTKLLVICLLIPLLSFLGFWLFNRRKRYESSLVPPAAGLLGGAQKTLWKQFRLSTVFQTGAPFVFAGLCWFASFRLLEIVFFVDLVLITALARDVVDHFRRLLFLFGPLYKMQVRVAKEDEDRAWAILEGLEVEEV